MPVLALLYMPTPLVAALIAERGLRRSRFAIPRGRSRIRFFTLPVVAILSFAVLHLALIGLGGGLLHLPGFGALATTPQDLEETLAALVGPEALATASAPPPPIVLGLAGLVGSIVAGWTINGLFAMGEEYGWRGLLWEHLRGLGAFRANLLLGAVWGLWHAPLILQGYNYGDQPLLGVGAMVVLAIPMSFVLTAIRELTGSVIPVAAAHGMFNAIASVLILLTLHAELLVSGPVGLVAALALAVVAAVLWRLVHRRAASAPPVPTGAVAPLAAS
ncbi:CPBP family intramembrane glutamic endopeptidase [Naasia aerilata]|uniref:CAAX amino protease n=1 Tax=Naasia aerilata TaxID=1162966 RepID=A0ABM8G9X2_9MICO|nr:CPBP family intramembrane glutamic endopeptidase [Naasia aerilata]BDZ45000.1 CAAX amino protease [Naasia aerilata]